METTAVKQVDKVVIKFAGDSGDGMQLTGTQFTGTSALLGNDIATFPDYPAEIRAPQDRSRQGIISRGNIHDKIFAFQVCGSPHVCALDNHVRAYQGFPGFAIRNFTGDFTRYAGKYVWYQAEQ